MKRVLKALPSLAGLLVSLGIVAYALTHPTCLRPPADPRVEVHYTSARPVLANGTINGSPIPGVPPASPHYYVASTGNDGYPCTTSGSPCATPMEVTRRLAQSGWSGQPIVTFLDKPNLGTNPNLNIPAPSGSANPILLQGTYVDSGLGQLTPTGGTQGTITNPPALATVVCAAATFTNHANEGEIASFDSSGTGPNAGTRAMIHMNSTTTLTVTGRLAGAPTSGDVFHVLNLVGGWSFTGNMIIHATGGVIMDGLEITELTGSSGGSTGLSIVGIAQWTAMRFLANAGNAHLVSVGPGGDSGSIYDNGGSFFGELPFPVPAGITPCGTRYDGISTNQSIGLGSNPNLLAVGTITSKAASMVRGAIIYNSGNNSVQIFAGLLGAMDDGGIVMSGGTLSMNRMVITNGQVLSGAGAASVIDLSFMSVADLVFSSLTGVTGGGDLVHFDHAHGLVLGLTGTNASAGVAFTEHHSSVTCTDASTGTTLSGASSAGDVLVGTNSATSLANIASTAATRIDTNTATYFGP